jgi:hypothetical protein
VKAGKSFHPLNHVGPWFLILFIFCGCSKKDSEDQPASTSQAGEAHLVPVSTWAAAPMDRLQWNVQTLVGSYIKSGHRDPVWDESATNALARFALIRSANNQSDEDRKQLASYCREAVLKGCEDPVILYLHTRNFTAYQEETTHQLLADGYKKAITALRKHPCAPIRQAYLALRASEAINSASDGKGTAPDVHRFRHGSLQSLLQALKDPGIPPVEVQEACRDLLAAVKSNPKQHLEFFAKLEPILSAQWPDEAVICLLKGRFHIDEAWRVRGNGMADAVTEDGWKGFKTQLGLAEAALEKGWKLDPKNVDIPYEMMSVELGQGHGRERMEQWFQRAMNLNTNGAGICKRKLYYLEPKWHGSAADMLQFARECATSEKWGGEVLLMPLKAHETLAGYAKRDGDTNYWKNPSIWREIKGALDRYYERHPDDASWRHNYAWHAYNAEEWNEFNKQLRFFTTGTNYQYFGGQETFERMVKNGRQRAGADR